MSTIPFAGAGPSEVIARVAYRLVVRDYNRNQERYITPNEGVRALITDMRTYECTLLCTALHSLAAFLAAKRGRSERWRDEICYRSRYAMAARRAGRPWQKCPTPLLVTRGSDDETLEILEAPIGPATTSKGKRGRKNAY